MKKILIYLNIKPYKIVKLDTSVICEHYKNGNIKVITPK